MSSNDQNNDSVSLPELDSEHIIQPVEKRMTAATFFFNLKKGKVDCDLQDTHLNPKRKISENSSNNMDKGDLQTSSESVKRRRYSESSNEVPKSNDSSSVDEKKLNTLIISNSPGDWGLNEVIKFVKNECGVQISSISDKREKDTKDYHVNLKFDEKEKLHEVLAKLREKEAQGKLSVHFVENTVEDSESDADSEKTLILDKSSESKVTESAGPSKSNEDLSMDTNEFYIRESYLDLLGIKPPITNWVSVTNFRCDKSELKDVLELAGRVLVCSVSMNTKHANVMYSHPLEALQAVSMLNGQQYYGKNLQVKMSSDVESKMLPKGLVDVGPGLGKYGKPLQDIGQEYKRFIKGKSSNLDACVFQTEFLKKLGRTLDEDVVSFVRIDNQNRVNKERRESLEKENGPKSQGTFGPVGQKPANIPVRTNNPVNSVNRSNHMVRNQMQSPIRGPVQTMVPRPYQEVGTQRPGFPMVHQGLMYPNCPPVPGLDPNDANKIRGQVPGPMSPMVRPQMVGPNRFPVPGPMMGPGTYTGPGQGIQRPGMMPPVPMIPNGAVGPNIPYATNVRMFKGPDPTCVQMTNLPPTTNFVNLGQKLSELGHVVFLELTTPGCANVRFATPADADRCLQNYHQVMG